ncbi:putative Subtilase family protein [Candidatus Nitrosotalea okcheonensis]|uniref:Putative Subtilase family protein n=2 Tax=Candidatus Nitrosotalea okcheonensis TaxID=1903276 RepID=A0A2H1FHU3_9ARCH|nr:putative Subtilase family protein [Candidatus Nitrosotalea okcheonensis]
MVKKKNTALTIGFFLIFILLFSLFPRTAMGSYDMDLPKNNLNIKTDQVSGLINFQPSSYQDVIKRYIVFGSGSVSDIVSRAGNVVYGMDSNHGSVAMGFFNQDEVSNLKLNGYDVVEDLPLEFDSIKPDLPVTQVSTVDDILGSNKVTQKYGYTGNGIKIGIVDTGTDFTNPDVKDSVARDKNNVPVMIDADGQGIVLTNTTFVANINSKGVVQNYTNALPKNVTSSVYVTSKGVFLDLHKKGKGTYVQVYNSLYPKGGNPVLNGTVSSDYKIGKDSRHFIISKSGVYHFGMIYESVSQGQYYRLQIVPVLVVDSNIAGLYDTIIADMSDSWKDYKKFNSFIIPKYDFDFTDETPITLGGGNENLIYDSNHDGNADYGAGTVGARVLDVYGVIAKPSRVDQKLGAMNGTLLPPLDPHGNFFGVMYDFGGHGTETASSITSTGKQSYGIYTNSTKYHIKGIAPGAKIVPIKALWLGDAIYGWLWAAGFDQEKNQWKYSGNTRVDIISNSWGISTFPALKSVPGLDIQSLLLGALCVPHSLDVNYPGVLVVSSSGNAGPGYGTIGIPDAAPFGITVGAVTDNVFVGYGPFKNQPRFGNSTSHYGEVSGFSSKGPSLIGDPKPDLMAVGEYSYVPTSLQTGNNTHQYGLFGGTSLAAPLVAGSAAVLMESLKDKNIPYDSFTIKNILMSTATDLGNDPFSQGAGLINVTRAIDFVLGNGGVFEVYNDASYRNTKKILDAALETTNSSSVDLSTIKFTNSFLPETSWFGGRLYPGDRTSATFTIVNPTNDTLEINIEPQKLGLIKTDTYNGTTQVQLQDPLMNKSGTYRPDYVPLQEIKNHAGLASFFENINPVPDDASLLVLNLAFPFSQFMNSSAKTYADDMKISSLYLYDWDKKNNASVPVSQDLSLINRGGVWGTVQELRVSDPATKIKHVPLVGVYPVPTRYSYWTGDTKKNSTSTDYTLTASYYKKVSWNEIWLNSKNIQVKPHESAKVIATLIVPQDQAPGLYQAFLTFEGKSHTVNVPVSYAVMKKLQPKDLPTVIHGRQGNTLYGNGYIGGGFDMANRYNAGDWRQYYFDVTDKTINSVAMTLSWEDPNTNLSVFVVDPQGKIIQTNTPPGVLGQFQGWPTGDWLGPSIPFSEGGGFYPIKNKDATSTVLYASINQTGVYSVLIHAPLFGGRSIAEPITIAAKFSTILPIESQPKMIVDIPLFINNNYTIAPKIIGQEIEDEQYYLDNERPKIINQTRLAEDVRNLSEGEHDIKFVITDTVGHYVSKEFKFIMDNTAPQIIVQSPQNNSKVSGVVNIDLDVNELNLAQKDWLTVQTPKQTFHDVKNIQFDTTDLANGNYTINATAKDRAGNVGTANIVLAVDNSGPNIASSQVKGDQDSATLVEILVGIGIASAITVFTLKRLRISKRG